MARISWARRAVGVVVASLAVSSMAACGTSSAGTGSSGGAVAGSWQAVVTAAEHEGTVNFFSVMPDVQNNRLAKAFAQKYPNIPVSVRRGAGELPSAVEAQIQSGSDGADVFLYSDPAWFAHHDKDLMSVDGPSLQGWGTSNWVVDKKAIIPSAYPYSMIVWNTNQFPNGFKTWNDLLDPSVKGKVGLRSDVTTSLAGYLDFQQTEFGAGYLKQMGQQKPKFYPSVVPMTQSVASGEIGVTNASTPSVVKELKDKGAPIESLIPTPSYWIQWGAAALEKTKRPNASRVFLDFMMSAEGQAAINGDGFGAAGRDGVPGAIAPQSATMFASEKYTPAVIADFKTKFTEWFG